jgi:hypothetical protein
MHCLRATPTGARASSGIRMPERCGSRGRDAYSVYPLAMRRFTVSASDKIQTSRKADDTVSPFPKMDISCALLQRLTLRLENLC